jgi:phosphoglycolate phosphatase
VTASIRLIVFDLDGTLIDSWKDLADSANQLGREYGASPLEDRAIAKMVGDGAAVLIERVFAASGLGVPPADALQRFLAIYDTRLLVHTGVYPGIREMLGRLATRVRLAVLTNKPSRATTRLLEGLDLMPFISATIAGDGSFPRKPDPTGFRHLMAEAGVSPFETLLVGDSAIDLETARRAGTRVCLARYGFGYRPEEMDLRGDEILVDSPAEIAVSVSSRVHSV